MVAIGSKALPLRRHRIGDSIAECSMVGEDNDYNQGGRRKNMGRKSMKKNKGSESGGAAGESHKSKQSSNNQEPSVPHTSFLRFEHFFTHVL